MTTQTTEKNGNGAWTTIGKWIQIVTAVALPLMGYFARDVIEQIRDHDRRITVNEAELRAVSRGLTQIELRVSSVEQRVGNVEGNRFTDRQGEGVSAEISKIWIELSVLKGKIPTEFPPVETTRRIEKIEDRILEIERKAK